MAGAAAGWGHTAPRGQEPWVCRGRVQPRRASVGAALPGPGTLAATPPPRPCRLTFPHLQGWFSSSGSGVVLGAPRRAVRTLAVGPALLPPSHRGEPGARLLAQALPEDWGGPRRLPAGAAPVPTPPGCRAASAPAPPSAFSTWSPWVPPGWPQSPQGSGEETEPAPRRTGRGEGRGGGRGASRARGAPSRSCCPGPAAPGLRWPVTLLAPLGPCP